MDSPRVASPGEWLAARKKLLAREKEVTRAKDAAAASRRALPAEVVGKNYVFTGPDGTASLADLFDERRQLITCSVRVDGIGHLAHLHACDTTLVLVSRAPIASIERFRQRMGWSVPWYSSEGSDFNYDFHASFDEDVTPIEYNYQDKATLKRTAPYIRPGTDGSGVSVFLRDGDRVLHTYSAYARGLDQLIGTYTYLDLTPLGRQKYVTEFPHHDRYDAGA